MSWLALLGMAALVPSVTIAQPPGMEGRGERGPGPGRPGSPVVQALDTDGDGQLSAEEIKNAAASLLKLDKDKNGILSAEELRPQFGPGWGGPGREGPGGDGFGRGGPGRGGPGGGGPDPKELVDQLMTFDKNKDGKLDREELPERMAGILDRADANKDGLVDREELTKLAEQQAARREGSGRGGREFERRGFDRGGERGPDAAPRGGSEF